jgi:hypothetical protein
VNNINKKLKFYALSVFIVTALSIYTIGCADDPSSLGLNFIPPGETTGVRIFDSYIDTMQITSSNVKYYVNTSSSANLMVGKNGSYDSKALIKFSGISSDYDSATVNSATLTLKYKNYYFPAAQSDSLGQISFDIYKVLQNISYSTVTLDSVTSSSFGTTSQGNYTGTPTADSQEVSISLNTSMVKDWLEYAADTNYSGKNYGITMTPNNASNVIKAFYSGILGEDVRPKLQIIVTKNNDTDTLTTTNSETVSLVDASITPNNETFSLQAGVSYVQIMKFDMSKIPSTATINDAQLYLTLDTVGSKFTRLTTYKIGSLFVSDTAGYKTTGFSFDGSSTGTGQYMTRLVASFQVSPFQRWLLGETNYGILIFASNQTKNLDLFSFYGPTASDPNKRPRVVIKYTPRVTP